MKKSKVNWMKFRGKLLRYYAYSFTILFNIYIWFIFWFKGAEDIGMPIAKFLFYYVIMFFGVPGFIAFVAVLINGVHRK